MKKTHNGKIKVQLTLGLYKFILSEVERAMTGFYPPKVELSILHFNF